MRGARTLASSSGVPDRPPCALPFATHEKPIIAARERELREMSRSRMYMRAAQGSIILQRVQAANAPMDASIPEPQK